MWRRKARRWARSALIAEEDQPAGIMQGDEPVEEQATEERPEHPHRQEESGARGDPAPPVRRQPAAGHDHVHVRMMGHRRAPGVEHGRDADAGTEVLGIRRDRHHRVRGRPEQQVVDHGLVLERDIGDLGRQGEDEVEIADRQQIRLALGKPVARGGTLTLGAVPVATAIVGDPEVAAVFTSLDMAAQRGGPAMLDGCHDLELVQAQMPGVSDPVGWACCPEDIGDLQRGGRHASACRPHPGRA